MFLRVKRLVGVLFAFIFIASGCSENKDTTTTSSIQLKYYVMNNPLAADTTEVSEGDTLSLVIGDSLFIISDVTMSPSYYSGLLGDANVDITKRKSNEYRCVAKGVGLSSMGVYAYNTTNEISKTFYVKVPDVTFYYQYRIVGNTYSVDADDESLKSTIESELENGTYAPQAVSFYILKYKKISGGDLYYTLKGSSDTISGTFTTSDFATLPDINMTYNSHTYNYTSEWVAKVGFGYPNTSGYSLNQDLTDTFRSKYPSATINSVTISSFALRSRVYTQL